MDGSALRMLAGILAFSATFLHGSNIASAHPIAVNRGVVTVHKDRITVSLQVTGEDLLHQDASLQRLDRLSSQQLDGAFERYAARLCRMLVLRDISGRRMEGKIDEWHVTPIKQDVLEYRDFRAIRATFLLEYPTVRPPALVTFRQEDPEQSARMPVQFALLVRQLPIGGERSIRLTAGGNAETLEFDWSDGHPSNAGALHDVCKADDGPASNRFNSVLAILRIEQNALKMDIRVPVPLMETWVAIPRREPDFLHADDQRAALPRLTEFFSTLHLVELNARPVRAQLRHVGIIGPAASGSDAETAPQTLGIFTARVAVSIEYGISEEVRDVEITWGLFNNAVLTTDVTLIDGESARSHQFSTYAPKLSHQRR